MTAKRFTLGVCEKGLGLTDNLTKEQYLETDDKTLIRLCELLNELNEEINTQNMNIMRLSEKINDCKRILCDSNE
jgi:hypothetical protein